MRNRTLLASIIVTLSALTGVFIVGRFVVSSADTATRGAHLAGVAKSIQQGAPTTPQTAGASADAGATEQFVEGLPPAQAENLTQRIAEEIAAKVLALNPEGPLALNGESAINALDPEALIDGALADTLQSFDYDQLIPTVDPLDLMVTTDTSPKAFLAYVEGFKSALVKNSVTWNGEFSIPFFRHFEEKLGAATAAMYALAVPKPLAPLHAEEISFLTAQQRVFGMLADASSDPARALFAVQAMPAILNRFASLQQRLNEVIQAHLKP